MFTCRTRRRLLLWGAATLVLAAPHPALAYAPPSADELIDKAVEAMGGKAIEKIKSYQTSSEMTVPTGTMTSDLSWVEPGRIIVKRVRPQMGEVEMGTDGTIGWMKAPMMGGYQLVEGDQLDEIVEQAIHIRMLRLRETIAEEFNKTEGVAQAEFDGAPCWELSVAKLEEDKTERARIYFDTDSGLVRGLRTIEEGPAGPQESVLKFKDWKKIGDVNFFHAMEFSNGMMEVAVRYTRIEVNSVKPEAVAVPDEVKALAKEQAGKPPSSEMTLEDFSPQVQQMIKQMMDRLPEDPAALRGMRDSLQSQVARMPGEFKKGMEYVIRKIDERLEQQP